MQFARKQIQIQKKKKVPKLNKDFLNFKKIIITGAAEKSLGGKPKT